MLSQLLFGLSIHDPWVTPVAGVGATALVAALGYFIFLRQRPKGPPPPPTPPPQQPDPFDYGAAGEQRKAIRRRGNHTKVVVGNAEGNQELGIGWVIDRSMGGVCLTMDEAIAVGSILSIKPLNAPGNLPWVQIEIRSCRKRDVHWELGCMFVRPPAWSVLLLFG